MKNATMLYRCPGPHRTDGIAYDYMIVDAPDADAALAEGWHRNWHDAAKAMKGIAEELAANESEQKDIEQKLAGLTAVHKGRGKWAVVDASGAEVQSGLTKEQAEAACV